MLHRTLKGVTTRPATSIAEGAKATKNKHNASPKFGVLTIRRASFGLSYRPIDRNGRDNRSSRAHGRP